MNDKINVLIADDQELIRESLQIVLSMEADLHVVGVAENGSAAIRQCEQAPPDVVLMDIHMPEMDGVEATKRMKRQWPDVRVMMLTTFQEMELVREALTAGADGYLLKAIHPKDLAAGIRLVHRGGTLIPQEIARILIAEWSQTPSPSTDSQVHENTVSKLEYGLTERELQVLRELGNGLGNRDIASKLYLSEGTVRNYISSIYAKLGVTDRFQAAMKAQQEGVI